jgi:hypothetical protein
MYKAETFQLPPVLHAFQSRTMKNSRESKMVIEAKCVLIYAD